MNDPGGLYGPAIMSQSAYRPYQIVPWAMMLFPEVQAKDMLGMVKRHISGLPQEKAIDYIKYLIRQCGYPRTVFDV